MTSRRMLAIGAAFAGLAIVVSLSDRAPDVGRRIADMVQDVWHRVETALAIDIDREAIPWSADEIAHLLLWGGGMVLLGVALRNRYRPDRIAVGLFAASITLEILQVLVTAHRSLSLADGAANAVGIMLGLTVVVGIELVWPIRSPAAQP